MPLLRNRRAKDYLGGILVTAIGAGAIFQGSSYSVGTLTRMGSGFFPVVLGVILALTGLTIAAQAHLSVASNEERKPLPPEWRGWLCISAAIIAFVAIGSRFGLLAATFAVVFVSALGDRTNTVKSAALLALAVMVICVVVFWWALQLQFPLF